jgi:hypothetical protein
MSTTYTSTTSARTVRTTAAGGPAPNVALRAFDAAFAAIRAGGGTVPMYARQDLLCACAAAAIAAGVTA